MNQINRAVGAIVRLLGFPGSRGVWSRITDDGIAAIGTTRSVRSSQRTIYAQVAMGAVPRAWWEYRNHRFAQWGEPPIPYDADAVTYDIGFVESRRRPEGAFYHMKFPPNGFRCTTQDEVDHAIELLTGAAAVLAETAIDLVRPGRYLEELSAIPDREVGFWEPFVVLLAERGPSADLDDAIEEMRGAYDAHGSARPDDIVAYARTRAASR
ncbi:hypothetical protein HDA40_002876 [Hamadaea flava]|uniref:Uncharacterized protein n=1 Tax=Hamadaea flava TaxID=1742688 RepID=A0ABV8LIJ7_9ACTN|nr:hypothetical protein [Hamadaea flava]MCP2324369.1 hypothetical protein [Hamadaea flava]